jgi:hypothetical protein
MVSKLIALLALVSLLVGIVQLPLPAAAATAVARSSEHSDHHCCPKVEQTRMAVIPALPSLPCEPNHSCCSVRAPAKLPSMPAGARNGADRHPVRIITVNPPTTRFVRAAYEIAAIPVRSPLGLSTILRI